MPLCQASNTIGPLQPLAHPLDTLRQAFGDLEEKGELSGSADILKSLETSLEDPQVQPVQKEAAINRLANWLTRTYAKT